jgi:hypothetical protein
MAATGRKLANEGASKSKDWIDRVSAGTIYVGYFYSSMGCCWAAICWAKYAHENEFRVPNGASRGKSNPRPRPAIVRGPTPLALWGKIFPRPCKIRGGSPRIHASTGNSVTLIANNATNAVGA